ncbi:MAG: hypothetical protein ACXWCM_05675 [Acidimicrobiales bacterium]
MLLAVVVGSVALLVPLRTGLPRLTGGAGARQQSCGPAAVAWSDGLDEPGRTVPATTDPGRDTSVCREKSTGRIALGGPDLGGVVVGPEVVHRSSWSPP